MQARWRFSGYFQKHRELIGYSHFGHLFEGIKKRRTNDRSIVNLRRRAPDNNQCYFILIQKEKRKQGKAQGKAQDSKQKKRKRKEKGGKKNTLQDSNPRPSDLSFSAPHTIRPPAHGRVTSFPAYTNLTDIYDRKLHTKFHPAWALWGQNYKPRYARPSASLREENKTDFHIILPFIAIRGTPAEVSNAPVVRSSFFNTLK